MFSIPTASPSRPLAIVLIAKGRSVFLVESALGLMGSQAQPDGGRRSA